MDWFDFKVHYFQINFFFKKNKRFLGKKIGFHEDHI